MRFLFYSHDGMGLVIPAPPGGGSALTELAPDTSIMLATGADEVNRLGLAAQVEVFEAARASQSRQRPIHLAPAPHSHGRDPRPSFSAVDRDVKTFRPTVILVDKHPFGAGGEFREALEIARDAGAATVLGLRDILDAPEAVLAEWGRTPTRCPLPPDYTQRAGVAPHPPERPRAHRDIAQAKHVAAPASRADFEAFGEIRLRRQTDVCH